MLSQQKPRHAPGNMACYVCIREALYANNLLSGARTTCFKSSGTHDEGTDGISPARDKQAMYLLKRLVRRGLPKRTLSVCSPRSGDFPPRMVI